MMLEHLQRRCPLRLRCFITGQSNPVWRLQRQFEHSAAMREMLQSNVLFDVWIVCRRYYAANHFIPIGLLETIPCQLWARRKKSDQFIDDSKEKRIPFVAIICLPNMRKCIGCGGLNVPHASKITFSRCVIFLRSRDCVLMEWIQLLVRRTQQV